MSVLEIPITSQGEEEEFLEIPVDSLPEAKELIGVLIDEKCALTVWYEVAQQYYKQNMHEGFFQVLSAATDKNHTNDYRGSKADRIACLTTLSAYYLQLAEQERDPSKRESYIDEASSFYNRAELDDKNTATWLGRGFTFLIQGQTNHEEYFDLVMKEDKDSIPAKLGLANLHYNCGRYKPALELYRKCLRANPNVPPEVRLGLGQCLLQLERYDEARLAFERTLRLDPECVGALIGMAVLEFHSVGADCLMKGIQFVKQAYDLDPKNALVLNMLSDHFFFKKDYDKAFSFAQSAYQNCDFPAVKALSCFYIGRLYHVKDDYTNAFQYYSEATELDGKHALALYGLGQMYFYKGDLKKARESIDSAAKVFGKSYECSKMLCQLYSEEEPEKAKQCALTVTDKQSKDFEGWIERAMLYEKDNVNKALEFYNNANELLEKADCGLIPELLNNIAVLRFSKKDYDGAGELLQKAIDIIKNDTSNEATEYYSYISVTLNYNLGRLYESQGKFVDAENIHKMILKEHPNYVDCYLRLGAMASSKGLIYKASEWFKNSQQIDNSNLATRSMIGALHVDKLKWKAASDTFNGILIINPDDIYANIAIASIHHSYAVISKDQKKQSYYSGALKHFGKALELDNTNVYAANGIGAILAEQGNLADASDIFLKVREVTDEVCDVWINLAHVYCKQGKYVQAIKLYENCQKKFFGGRNVEVMIFQGRALFKAGSFMEARKVLTRALHLAPNHGDLQYNLACCHQRICLSILQEKVPTMEDLVIAKRQIKHAIRIFSKLTNKNPEKYEYTKELARKSFYQSRDLYSKANVVQAKVKKDDERRQALLTEKEKKLTDLMLQKKLAEEQKIEEEARKRKELEELRKEQMEEQQKQRQELNETFEIMEANKVKKKVSRSKKKDKGSGSESGGESGEEGEKSGRKRAKKTRKKRSKKAKTDGDDEDKPKRKGTSKSSLSKEEISDSDAEAADDFYNSGDSDGGGNNNDDDDKKDKSDMDVDEDGNGSDSDSNKKEDANLSDGD